MHPRLKNVTERAQKYDFSVNIPYKLLRTSPRPDILCLKVDIKRHCVFPLNLALKETFQLKMHPHLKDATERAQKYDFSVNFHILIEQTGFRSDILCQKVDIKRHCVFPLNLALKETFQL